MTDNAKLNRNSGLNMLEVLLVLALIAIIILMATRYFLDALGDLKVSQTTQQIRKITIASFDWIKGEADFSKFTQDDLKNDNYLSKNDLNGFWGGSVKVVGAKNSAKQYTRITITIPSVPASACNTMNDILQKENYTIPSCGSSTANYAITYPAT